MVELMAVKDYAQQIAEAIATVVKIDIEISDHNLIRIAGTGKYHKGVGRSMDRQGYVYQEVLRTRDTSLLLKRQDAIPCALPVKHVVIVRRNMKWFHRFII